MLGYLYKIHLYEKIKVGKVISFLVCLQDQTLDK